MRGLSVKRTLAPAAAVLSLTLSALALAPTGTLAYAQSSARAVTSAVAVNPTAHDVLLVLSDPPHAKLTFIGPSWRVTKALGDVNAAPDYVGVSPDGKYAVVTMEGYTANELEIFGGVNTRHPHLTARLKLPAAVYPEMAALTADDQYAYVPGGGINGDTVGVFDGINTSHPKLVDSLLLNTPGINDSEPCGIAISPNGKYAYATDYAFGTLTVITGLESGAPEMAPAVKIGQYPCRVWPSANGKYLYKINSTGTKVTVLGDANSTSPRVLDSVKAGTEPDWIGVTPDGRYLYAPSGASDKVALLSNAESAHPKVIRTLTAGPGPLAVVVSPNGQYAYVSDLIDGRVTVYSRAQTGRPRTVNPPLKVAGQQELIFVARLP